jgi:CubicO group peptidase (beta-lactamase class C family)
MIKTHACSLTTLAVFAGTASAMSTAELEHAVVARFANDRTGACIAAAVVDDSTATAFVCADPAHRRAIDAHTTFEIGSITKTMTAILLARMIERGDIALDSPLAELLPDGTKVPTYRKKPITLGHVVTHASGLPALPARMNVADAADPYATLTTDQLLGSLADVTLDKEPGTSFRYSNFAMMVLSYGIAHRAGKDFETLLVDEVFEPLRMNDAHVARPRHPVNVARGHLPNGNATSPWTLPVDMSGVGGVRASLTDMVHYVEAHLGRRTSASVTAIARTQQPVATVEGQDMAMNWMRVALAGRRVLLHEGGTGGFSSLVAIDRERGRGIVLLADTSLGSVGGLGPLGMHLLEPAMPPGTPRTTMKAPADLVDALVGEYAFPTGMRLAVTRRDDRLVVQATGQDAFELDYDSAGDFYPTTFDAVLRPMRQSDGRYAIAVLQGGGMQQANRTDALSPATVKPSTPTAGELREYEGTYPLMPGFELTVSVKNGKLYIRGTGQPALDVVPAAKDVFVRNEFGAEFTFARNDAGDVIAVTLKQHGQTLRGAKR